MENKGLKALFEVNKKIVLAILIKLKSYKVLTKPVYWTRKKITIFVKAIANIINLQVELKN